MRLLKYLLISTLLLTSSCNDASKLYPKAENGLDAGREFIDGCLKGDFKKASFYMLDDAENRQRLEGVEKDYSLNNADQKEYNSASIIIDQEEILNDTLEIIHYRNSFDKIARKVKVVLQNGNWLVDFKYTFNGNL